MPRSPAYRHIATAPTVLLILLLVLVFLNLGWPYTVIVNAGHFSGIGCIAIAALFWFRWHGRTSGSPDHAARKYAFRYVSLGEGEIRLLSFGRNQDVNGMLHFELSHARLSQRPRYTTLSYSWGSARDGSCTDVVVNGQAFSVSVNLASALSMLRQQGHQMFWVDAICINQSDPGEKSKEVTRMFSIYRIATEVVIWLGYHVVGDEEVQELQKVAGEISEGFSRAEDDVALKGAIAGLRRLLMAPYWSRVWILQEVAAARRTRVCWGGYRFELHVLETMIRDYGLTMDETSSLPTLAQQVLFVRSATRAQQKPRLMEILQLTHASETSVVRDKVYGLLGLASDWRDFVQEPNYSPAVSEESLCLEMTANFVHWYTCLDIILLRSTENYQQALPSWCPDYFHFKIDAFDHNLIAYVSGKDANLAWEKRRAFGAAARIDQDVQGSFHVDGRHLCVRGVREGYITMLGVMGDKQQSHGNDAGAVVAQRTGSELAAKAFRRLLLMSHAQTFGHLSGAEFFALLYGLPQQYYEQTGYGAIWRWLQGHAEFFHTMGVWPSGPAPVKEQDQLPMRIRSSGLMDESRLPAGWKEYSSSSTWSNRRRGVSFEPLLSSISCVLDEGVLLMSIGDEELLGWAHRKTQVGDSIWHLEGCTLPTILRRRDGASAGLEGGECYELIGHGYVDPVMASGRWLAREDKSRLIRLI